MGGGREKFFFFEGGVLMVFLCFFLGRCFLIFWGGKENRFWVKKMPTLGVLHR